ncbi:SDR family oxidoreductase [Spirulina sp. CS-785/01]|uniref:SDR family oxidoreductase n=1 Tax=Spirulina sp. CS-785/01 TaxID=3021716 RepID=UPI002330612B|nr:SDR family oxidoreductase [Spirulina sp. CS-785/01]MDB9314276.1 SDR family oxidoreductase [Spirulina sp. CS-785/01]
MYLVTGATGSLGRRVVRVLRDRNLPVRAFVRLSSNYRELEDRGAELLIGDLRNSKDIQRATQGVRYIISAHSAGQDAQSLEYRANIELIDSAKAQGVQHYVYTSVMGVEQEKTEDSPTFKAKRQVEKSLQNSGLNYTILRPAGFANNLLPLAERFKNTGGFYLLIGSPKNRSSIVSTDDVARIAADSPTLEAAQNKIFPVGGPDILTREDIPNIFARVFNQDPLVINPPLWLFDNIREGIGLVNPDLKNSLATLRTLLANEFFCTPEEVSHLEATYNCSMESLESFLRRYLGK